MAELPIYLRNDPRIGRKARRKDGKFSGVIESILRYSDGVEHFQLKNGAFGNGGLEAHEIVIEQASTPESEGRDGN